VVLLTSGGNASGCQNAVVSICNTYGDERMDVPSLRARSLAIVETTARRSQVSQRVDKREELSNDGVPVVGCGM